MSEEQIPTVSSEKITIVEGGPIDEKPIQTERKETPAINSVSSSPNNQLTSILTSEPEEELVSPTSLPKKSFPKVPKIIFFAAVAVLFLAVLGFVAVKLKSKDKNLVGKKGEIIWWGIQEETGTVAPLIEEYQNKNPKVKVTYIKQSTQDYRERLTNALKAGKGPDIFEIHNTWAPMFRDDLELAPASIMTPTDFANTFYPVIASDLAVSTGVVAVPLFFDAITLYINEDILASAAKAPPKTWDELRDLAIQLTQRDEKGVILQSGVSLGRTENVDHWPEIIGLLLLQNQANPAKPAGELTEGVIAFFTRFSSSDRVWDERLPVSTIAFAQGKVAMYFGPARRAPEIAKLNSSLKFKTVPVPQLPKEKPSEPDINYATYWAQGVWARSINKEAAWDFLKFLSTQESLKTLNNEAKKVNNFERPYPRIDMSLIQSENKIVASIISLALTTKSWYLASPTYDGPTGINSQINSSFARALVPKANVEKVLPDVESDVAKVLTQYGISVR